MIVSSKDQPACLQEAMKDNSDLRDLESGQPFL